MTVVGKIMKEKSTLTLQYHLPYMPAYSIKLITMLKWNHIGILIIC